MSKLLLYSGVLIAIVIIAVIVSKDTYNEKFSDTPCSSCDSCCSPNNPKIVIKPGNNGSVSCDTFCTSSNWGPAYSQAAFAYNANTGKFIPTSSTNPNPGSGLINLVCGCS